MSTTRYLGNDIVALTSPRCRGKIDDERFLQRILSPQDRAFVFSTPDPETALWLSWAGKEALFKSATKVLGSPPVFEHRKFRVAFSAQALLAGTRPYSLSGSASFQGLSVTLEAEVHEGFVHVLSWQGSGQKTSSGERRPGWSFSSWTREDERTEEQLLRLLSPREQACISHRASALTRLAARASLATVLKVEERRLEIGCGAGAPGRRVPLVFLDGREIPVDLTLSHDAHLMAWGWDVVDL